MQQIHPFLMFQRGQAAEAMAFYVKLFGGEVLSDQRFGAAGPGPAGTVMHARIRIAGLEVMFSDSPVKHAFEMTPATSLFVTCASEAELDDRAAQLSAGGRVLMPPGNYGFSRKFAWVDDRFGVSWQLTLP